MLALEARCLSLVRACGSQGVQNGAISCVALTMSLPGGTRAILAENLIAAWLDLEVASGNDAIASHSPTRRTAKLMGQFLPGTDFVTSGYSVMPRHDNTFGGGNYDADDLDEWMTLQRDWQVDAGIEPAGEEAVLAVRERAARAIQAVFDELGFPRRDRRRGRGRHALPLEPRRARSRPRRGRAGGRPRAGREHHRRRRRARARPPRLRRGGRAGCRHAAAASLLRLPADVRGDRRRGRRALGRQRPQRLPRPRHRLPPGRRPLGAAAGAAARARPGGRGPRRRERRPRAAARPGRLGSAAARPTRSSSPSGRPSAARCARRSAGSLTKRCCARSARASRRRASATG